MTIPETIDTVAKALGSGAAPSIIKLALMSDGYPANKADTIIGWAKLHIERECNDDGKENLPVPEAQG